MSTLAILLKESWSQIEDRSDELAQHFYARIFLADPGLRDLFPIEMTAQRSRLLGALVSVVQTIDDPDRFDEILSRLGRDHRKFHITPEHYGVVGAALLETLRHYSGDRWTFEYDQAWRDGYEAMAATMLRAAERDAHNPPYWHAEVLHHERRGPDIAVFTCRPLVPFRFRSGQYVSVECRLQPRVWRVYSIANAPRVDRTLDFHVRARGGWVSAALVRRLRVGDMIRLGLPMGSMALDHHSTRDVVCVAGGTGLAPIKALVEELAAHNRSRWVHVFVGGRSRDDLYDLPALNRLAARHHWLSVVPACSDDPTYSGETGDVNDVVERFGPWREHDFFVCGSPSMIRATLVTLSRMAVPETRVRYDAVTHYDS